jgi:hypothetical protein
MQQLWRRLKKARQVKLGSPPTLRSPHPWILIFYSFLGRFLFTWISPYLWSNSGLQCLGQKRHAVVDSLCGGCSSPEKSKILHQVARKNRLPSWLTKSTHFEVQCLLQDYTMIFVHVYRFTSPDSCARLPIYKPWFLCTFTDLQALILVHVYRFTRIRFTSTDSCAPLQIQKESDYVGHISTASGALLRN